MGILSFVGRLGDGIFGFVIKIMLFFIVLAVVLGLLAALAVYWPFTICMLIGILFSSVVYKRLNKMFGLRLPRYFYFNINDFMVTFYHGQDIIDRKQLELNNKIIQAREQLQSILNAVKSLDEQLKQIKTAKSLKTLFKRDTIKDINPRLAAHLKAELGRPDWSIFLDKKNKNDNGDWEKFKSVPDVELEDHT